MTELDAINIMLATVGEAPVSDIDTNNPEVGLAYITLRQVLREVCSEGWDFNFDHSYPLTPETNGEIPIPDNAIRLTVSRAYDAWAETTIREGKLYNKREYTSIFNGTVYVDVKWLIDFEDLPSPFQDYVAQRAARVFAGRSQANPQMVAAAAVDEERLRNNCITWDTGNRQPNMLDTEWRLPGRRPGRSSDVVLRW